MMINLTAWRWSQPAAFGLRLRLLAALCAIFALPHGVQAASCSSPTPMQVVNQSLVVDIPSDFDPTADPTPTTTIYFSLLLPARCPGDAFPMILQTPGYGGKRTQTIAASNALYPNNPQFESIDQLVQALPYYGYVVLSFDPRGLGESIPANGGGNARLIDPNAETQDARAILDWAYAHAAQYNIQTQPDSGIAKDIKVGTLGYSYGGGFQMPLAALDARIDTIVPNDTWYSLNNSLSPGESVKLSWDGALCVDGTEGYVSNTPLLAALCNTVGLAAPEASKMRSLDNLSVQLDGGGRIPPAPRSVTESEFTSFLYDHSMAYFRARQLAGQPWGYGETQAVLRPVPALFLQGDRDVLFNLTEAFWNQRYFAAAGANARLISTEGGHMNPFVGQYEGTANCGSVTGVNAILAWFNYYLKGVDSTTFDAIPPVCLSIAATVGEPNVPAAGLELSTFPVGSLSGAGAIPALLTSATVSFDVNAVLPQFIPITTIVAEGRVLAGVPTIKSLVVTAGAPDAGVVSSNAFIGIGIQRGRHRFLVKDQVTAFTAGTHTANTGVNEDGKILLPAVGEALQIGDRIGLLVYPEHPQYAAVASPMDLAGVGKGEGQAAGRTSPLATGTVDPLSGLLYKNPYSLSVYDVELPILVPGQFPGSSLTP